METIVILLIMPYLWHFKKREALKEDIIEESMPVARHPKRWWNWCFSEDEKKSNRPNFYR